MTGLYLALAYTNSVPTSYSYISLSNPLIILLVSGGYLASAYTLLFTRKLVRVDHDHESTAALIRLLIIANFILGIIGILFIMAALDGAIIDA